MATPALTNYYHRFYEDDNADPDLCTPIGAEGSVAETITVDTPFMVRITTGNNADANFNSSIQLEFRVDGGTWTNLTTTSTGARVATGTPTDDSNCDTQLLSSVGGDTFENDGGYCDDDGLVDARAHSKSTFWEDQWCVTLRSADLSGGEFVEFRATGTGTTMTYATTLAGITASVPGTAYTLDATTPGSVTITGTAANTEHHAEVQAEAGSVALTGTDALLEAHRLFSAESGSVAITGTDAVLSKSFNLLAEAGAVAVAGTDAALKATLLFAAEAGAVAITGTDATTERHAVLTAESGTLLLSGIAAGLNWTPVAGTYRRIILRVG